MTSIDRWRVSFGDATGTSSLRSVPNPPGFTSHTLREAASATVSTARKKDTDIQKRQQALQTRALSPWKQVAVLCFMMFMSSNTIQIFSLISAFSGIATSLQAIVRSGETFKPDAEGLLNTMMPRLIFCSIHLSGVLFGLYKLNSIGLLPTHASDWFSAMRVPAAHEYATSGLM